jgi:large subunit ribosomal protein L22
MLRSSTRRLAAMAPRLRRPLCTPAVPTPPPSVPRVSNPLLDVDVGAPAAPSFTPALSNGGDDGVVRMAYNQKQLPVSPKKLRFMANMTRGLYWREAMLQLEFCRKSIGIHVKNTIAKAVRAAEEEHGLDPTRLVVDIASVGKGTYFKELDYKAKGRAGIKRKYQSHLYLVLKQVTAEEVARTRHFGRWRKSASLLQLPWAERVQALPRYAPVAGYEPGEHRVRRPLVHDDALEQGRGRGVRGRGQSAGESGGGGASGGSRGMRRPWRAV